ncbi:hypothetical protein J2S52_005423 [Streptomyces sp. DSM 41037]|nr:hypothetical protein [Streptomyces sp. DSM 41037]
MLRQLRPTNVIHSTSCSGTAWPGALISLSKRLERCSAGRSTQGRVARSTEAGTARRVTPPGESSRRPVMCGECAARAIAAPREWPTTIAGPVATCSRAWLSQWPYQGRRAR